LITKSRLDDDLDAEVDLPEGGRRRLKLIPILPSMLTLGNLFCGFLAIAYTTDAVRLHTAGGDANLAAALLKIAQAGWVIFLAMIFDALDGRVARMTGQTSDFGGELDSLADMVTFGVAPAFMTKVLAEEFYGLEKHRIALGFSVVFVLCAALRLARYNVESDPEEGGHQSFMGLPSPGAAGLVAGIALIYSRFSDWSGARHLIGALPFAVPVLGLLMFSRIPYPHVMNRFFRGPKPMKYLVFLGIVVAFIVVTQSFEAAIAAVLMIYVLYGPVVFLLRLATGRAARSELEIFD
jgi:CDP-diacylglycerol--serine O-phosphatidyltransferase